jgi:aryl-alcohol dehydrogenase-like predicted oxidoreductase
VNRHALSVRIEKGSFMERRSFGNTDLRVSTIGVGCYGMSGVYRRADDAESIAALRCALDLGINFVDASPATAKTTIIA